MGTCFFLPMCWMVKNSMPADEFNAVSWKDKIFRVVECFLLSNDAWLFQLFYHHRKREGVQTHKARLMKNTDSHSTQPTVQLSSWCAIAWYFLFYLLWFLISSTLREAYADESSASDDFFDHCWCWLNKLQRLISNENVADDIKNAGTMLAYSGRVLFQDW